MEYRSYGYVRIFLYTLGGVTGAFLGSGALFFLARFFPLFRIMGRFLPLDMFVVAFLAAVTGFWLVNHYFIVPFTTNLHDLGFRAVAPHRPEREVNVNWGQIETVANWGFATYVSSRTSEGRRYRFLLGKDTDGYHRLTDTIRKRHDKIRYARGRGN